MIDDFNYAAFEPERLMSPHTNRLFQSIKRERGETLISVRALHKKE
jgi:hypothetical protein